MTQTRDKILMDEERKRHSALLRMRSVLLVALIFLSSVSILVVLSSLSIIPVGWSTIITALLSVLGASLAIFSLFPFAPESAAPFIEKSAYHSIEETPPLSSATILPRREEVRKIYGVLTQKDVTAVALTGAAGTGKSTLAALVYRYAEEQRQAGKGPFNKEALWLILSPNITMLDLVGTILDAQDSFTAELSNLTPQGQAELLFESLNITDKARLIVLDGFEQFLNTQEIASEDHSGIGKFLDLINTRPCSCRFLLTTRLLPLGAPDHPLVLLQEFQVEGMTLPEGIELLRGQGVQATEKELSEAVRDSGGSPLVLTQLAALVREHSVSLDTLFEGSKQMPSRLFEKAISELDQLQYELLLAFSVYREPVLLDAALAVLIAPPPTQSSRVLSALNVLLVRSLLESSGEDRYQSHPFVSEYVRNDFVKQTNEKALEEVHSRAAEYYLQQATLMQKQGKQDLRIHLLVEATWQSLQAGREEEAYKLARQENILQYLLSKD